MNYHDLDDAARADVLDSRDLIKLRSDLADELEYMEDEKELYTADERKDIEEQIAEIDQCEDYSTEWAYGAMLINESHFEDYARELADDIGAVNDESNWPNSCIDWEQAARELAMDYTTIEIRDTTFYVR